MIYGNWEKNSKEFLNDILNTSKSSEEILFVSGFSSIGFFSYLFKEIYTDRNSKTKTIRLILGNEISKSGLSITEEISSHFKNNTFDYFYFKGIETLRQFIKNKKQLDKELGFSRDIKLEVKIESGDRRLHAKIFVFDDSLIYGSSNLSYSGIVEQLELNQKIHKKDKYNEYKQISTIAYDLWNSPTAVDYTKNLLTVFEENIEILPDFRDSMKIFQDFYINGNWFKTATHKYQNELYEQLWIHQKRSIWQAIKILDEAGAVIIAEPTGSGKTKIASTILRFLYDKYSENNTLTGNIVVICPPNVETEWTEEIINKYKISGVDVVSAGVLANIEEPRNTKHLLNIKNAKILLLDEAHLYSNLLSKRAKNLLFNNQTDNLILLTATPLNKVLNDYKGLIMQIGGDCLQEEHVKKLNNYIFGKEQKKYVFELSHEDREIYKKAITSITVRKTKQEINKFSEENKHNLLTGRYPDEITKDYDFEFTDKEMQDIKDIILLRNKLQGFAYVNKDLSKSKQIAMELMRCRGLARHHLTYNLRSSKVALIEHIDGTNSGIIKDCFDYYKINKNNLSGKLEDLRNLKKSIKTIPKNVMIVWKDLKDLHNELDKEIETYQSILDIAKHMEDGIAMSKISTILKIMEYPETGLVNPFNKKCLIFDRTPITVLYLYHKINQKIEKDDLDIETLCITGENKSKELDKFKQAFGLDKNNKYSNKATIGFASNVLSESVNLQGADSLLFSDIPLTPTTADQRVGRISRMNSPYDEIFIYWPNFPDELFLNVDKLLVYRYLNINETIKANIDIPNILKNRVLTAKDSKITLADLNLDKEELDILKTISTSSEDVTTSNDEYESEIEKTEFENDFYEIYKSNEDIDIEDSFEKLNKFFQNLTGNNKVKNRKNKNIYNFISITDSEHTHNEWGLFVVNTNISTTPQIVFFDKKTGNTYLKMNEIVEQLYEKIPALSSIEPISLISTSVKEEEFSSTMRYYQQQIKSIYAKSSSILTKRQEKAFDMFKKYIEVLSQEASDKQQLDGFKEIQAAITDNNQNTPRIAQRWFNSYIEQWSEELKLEFSRNRNPFGGKIPLYEKSFSTDRMYQKMETSSEDIYHKYVANLDDKSKKITYKIIFAAVCFKKQQ